MKKLMIVLVLFVMALPFATTGGWEPVPNASGEAQSIVASPPPIDGKSIMGLINGGRSDSVITVLTEVEQDHPAHPMVLLLMARAMRDMLSDEDGNKDLIKRDVEPIHEVLDRALELCDKALDKKASDPKYRYYKGRGWLAKAQLHTLTRSYWSAGRAASKAKDNLEEYLKIAPDDPDAQGDLGAFLYFADTIPGVVKFFSKLLFIPGGDRDRGLQMLEYAATNDGVFSSDYQIALAAIMLVFEGRFEEGTPTMIGLIDRYPYYFRLVEPLSILAPLHPLKLREFQRIEDAAIARHLGRKGANANWNLLKSMQYHRSYANMFFMSPAKAAHEFASLIENPPARPDWVLPLAIMHSGHLYAKSGYNDEARKSFETVLADERMKHFHDAAKGVLKSLDQPWETIDLGELDFIGWIYDGRLGPAAAALEEFGERRGRGVVYHFYLGDLRLFEQDLEAARAAFEKALEFDISGGDETLQMFAELRLADLYAHDRQYGEAKKRLESALKHYHAEFLLDMLIQSRKRFYELLDDGKLSSPPTMFIANHLTPSEPGASDRAATQDR